MRRIELVIAMAITAIAMYAQYSKLDRNQFLSQIHLVDEFIDRFNGNSIRPNLPEEYANDRKSNILLLFDLAKFKSKNDTLFLKAKKFAERVVNDSIKIHYEDTAWYAKAVCVGTLHKNPVDFTLYLKVEKNSIGRYTWVIKEVEGKIFDLSSKKGHRPFTLMPDDHETNFMSLFRVTDETADFIMDYMSKDFIVDPTTIFLTWIKSNALKIEHVKDLQFVFNQVPGYQFSIKYVNRENANGGWLIDYFSEDKDFLLRKNAKQIVEGFAKNLKQLFITRDFNHFNIIKNYFSDGFRLNDEFVRSSANQKEFQELDNYDYALYENIFKGICG